MRIQGVLRWTLDVDADTVLSKPAPEALFAPTSTSDLMGAPKAPASLSSKRLMMLAMRSNNSMVTTGRAVSSKFASTALLTPGWEVVSAAAEASVVEEASAAVSVAVVDLVVAEDLVEVMAEEVATAAAAALALPAPRLAASEAMRLLLFHLTLSPTLRQLMASGARPSMSET